MQYLDELNPAQKEAAEHTDGPLMILAGAGAGKTKTITHRIAHLVHSGTPPENILAVTFTNKAAEEMRERVHALLGKIPEANRPLSFFADKRSPFIGTFHSLGVRLLREFGKHLGIPHSFTIWDRSDSMREIKRALTELGMEKQYEARNILGRISREKGSGLSHTEFADTARNFWEEAVGEVWGKYENGLEREHALDFDDLLLKTLVLLQKHPDVLNICRARWSHVTIDEYQDTNQVQFEIARLLVEPRNNICVVGDIDQNIYSWRGADISHLLSFEKVFPSAQTVVLEQNYRSTQTILAAAHDIISHNKKRYDKKLFTKNDEGEQIALYSAMSEADEARFVAEQTAQCIENGTPVSEIAVLYRANFQSRALEEAFIESGLSYRVLGTRFFERKEIKDVLSYVRAALNQGSRADISRIVSTPPRGIGKVTLMHMLDGNEDKLAPAARAKVEQFKTLLIHIREHAVSKTPSETIKYVIKHSGLEAYLMKSGEEGMERLENLKELVTLATKYDDMGPQEGIEKLLEDAALLGEQDSLDKSKDAVSLMTVHASKGLEFDVVFITGLEDGLFPHERTDEHADEEEERRLFYVALTRARKKVFLSHAMSRMMYGERSLTVPSEFLNDIDPAHLETNNEYEPREQKIDLIDF